MNCPNCNSTKAKVIETHRCVNDTKRRRYRCFNCEHRWTIWDGERPRKGGSYSRNSRKGRIKSEHVWLALQRTDLNHREVAQIVGCSGEAIRQIRCGLIYRHVHPDLIRPNAVGQKPVTGGPNCLDCEQWRDGRCSFGFPDPELEGLSFAADCDLYKAKFNCERL